MPKQIDIVYEMVFFVKKMPDNDKNSFKKFIEGKRFGKELISMFRAFERCSIDDPAKGLIKRLIVIKNGKDNRLFSKFKSWLFEFEITRKRTVYFKNKDPHELLEIELKKTYLAAQMMTDKDAFLTSIEVMKETYKRARRFEFLTVQQDCANNLSSFYSYTGDNQSAEDWKVIGDELNNPIDNYKIIYKQFSLVFQQIHCCPSHKQTVEYNGISASKHNLIKIAWMTELLNKSAEMPKQNPNKSFLSHLKQYRILKKNPGIFPLEFKAVITKRILEDLYLLGRHSVLAEFAKKIYLLDILPVHQRIPLLYFFLYYLLESKNYRILDLLLDDLNKTSVYHHFKPFVSHFRKIEIVYAFFQKEYKTALRKINRESGNISCIFQDFEFRFIEIMCLHKMKDTVSAFQKLENMRRFVFRNDECKSSLKHQELYRCLRSLLNNQAIISSNAFSGENVYDLTPLYMLMVNNQNTSTEYKSSLIALNKAAESHDHWFQ